MIVILVVAAAFYLIYRLERHMVEHAVEGWEDKYGTTHFEAGRSAPAGEASLGSKAGRVRV